MDAAAWNSQPGMVKMLLKAGADPNGQPKYPPLISAAFRGRSRIVTDLLAQPGIEVDKRGSNDYTPLMHAASRGQADVVELLLEAGADPSLKNDRGQTAEDLGRQAFSKIEGMMKRLEH